MSQSILLRGARQVLTLRGDPGVRRGSHLGNLAVIEDGSVFIEGGKIVAVGPTRRLENLKRVRGALEIPVHNCVVMPGFVDPAIQLSLAVHDGAGKLRRSKLGDFYAQGITLMRACLQHGTLNAGIAALSGVRTRGANLSVLRQLTRIGNNPVGLTRIWRHDEAEDLSSDVLAETVQTIVKRKLADAIDWTNSTDCALRDCLLQAASSAGMPTSLNWVGRAAGELEAALKHSSPAGVFCRLGLSPEECQVLAQSNSVAVFKAGSVLFDSPPGASLRNLVDAGGAVALGSGYDAVYEPNYNMQLVLALAVMRLQLTIEEAIVATTVNAAHAMNCGDQIGSLEPGKQAEVLVLNLSDYREIPRRLGVNHVAMAIRQGNLVINRTRWKVGAA